MIISGSFYSTNVLVFLEAKKKKIAIDDYLLNDLNWIIVVKSSLVPFWWQITAILYL